MNTRIMRFGYVILMMCVCFAGCKKADVTATATDPQLTFALVPDNPLVALASVKTTGTTTTATTPTKQVIWNAGTANITRFKLNAKRGGIATEYSSGNLTGVDVFNPSTLMSTISIPKGDYTEVKATISFSQTTAAPYPLVLTGIFTSNAVSAPMVPIEFDFNNDLDVVIPVSNIIADGSKDFTATIAMHLDKLMYGIAATEIDALPRTSNGTILIIKTGNPTAATLSTYNKIKANMVGCSAAVLTNRAK